MKLEDAFARILKEHRQKKGVSQETLALESGLDRTFISLLERGLRQPSLTTIFVLANSLNLTPGKFVNLVYEKTLEE